MPRYIMMVILVTAVALPSLSALIVTRHQPKTTQPQPATPGTMHVYLATQTGLTYICQTDKTVSQVITCASGETVLLTEQLHKQIVLTTAKLP